ncbi:Arm DNA-binding domain-containing protein [Paraburkholderia sp. RL17-337-BIB-A]|uniref:Arm DNA-binding domain-containing protein n=1 Tax=Paraburkholderia sp. RL17-337-BIB-A TaxID=3031636 RepID=UPI0038B9E4E4
MPPKVPKHINPLSDMQVCKAKPADKSYRLVDGKGLYLEVMPNGSRYWRMKYRFVDKEKRAAFDVYPEVSLAEARERCVAARKLLASSIDPSGQKRR